MEKTKKLVVIYCYQSTSLFSPQSPSSSLSCILTLLPPFIVLFPITFISLFSPQLSAYYLLPLLALSPFLFPLIISHFPLLLPRHLLFPPIHSSSFSSLLLLPFSFSSASSPYLPLIPLLLPTLPYPFFLPSPPAPPTTNAQCQSPIPFPSSKKKNPPPLPSPPLCCLSPPWSFIM